MTKRAAQTIDISADEGPMADALLAMLRKRGWQTAPTAVIPAQVQIGWNSGYIANPYPQWLCRVFEWTHPNYIGSRIHILICPHAIMHNLQQKLLKHGWDYHPEDVHYDLDAGFYFHYGQRSDFKIAQHQCIFYELRRLPRDKDAFLIGLLFSIEGTFKRLRQVYSRQWGEEVRYDDTTESTAPAPNPGQRPEGPRRDARGRFVAAGVGAQGA